MATTPEGLSFKGCRDSPSPVRVGSVQRASKSRRYHHRVVLESPLERHLLEGHLEHLWEETGTEFRFIFSSADSHDMEFLLDVILIILTFREDILDCASCFFLVYVYFVPFGFRLCSMFFRYLVLLRAPSSSLELFYPLYS